MWSTLVKTHYIWRYYNVEHFPIKALYLHSKILEKISMLINEKNDAEIVFDNTAFWEMKKIKHNQLNFSYTRYSILLISRYKE